MFQYGGSYPPITGDGGNCIGARSGIMGMNGGMGIGAIITPYSGYEKVGLAWVDLTGQPDNNQEGSDILR
jgi:hypothetical protein